MIFYFSGTGNSLWIARKLAETHKEQLFSIPEEMRNHPGAIRYALAPDEKIGFVFPVYSWGPPRIVEEFVEKLSFDNYHAQYLFFVCSCGDDVGLTRQVFVKRLEKKGWNCRAGFSVIMPNTYVLMKGFDTDPKEVEERKLFDAVPAVEHISAIIESRRDGVFLCKEGSFAWIKTKLINPLFNTCQISAKPFRTTGDCISCGLCVEACPVENIKLKDKPVWENHCTSCLACYHICPRQAVQYGNATKGKGQYFNTLNE